MAQQTAVEFIENLMINGKIRLTKEQYSVCKEITDLAKKMEKQQIIEAFYEGMDYYMDYNKDASKYYHKTFGNE